MKFNVNCPTCDSVLATVTNGTKPVFRIDAGDGKHALTPNNATFAPEPCDKCRDLFNDGVTLFCTADDDSPARFYMNMHGIQPCGHDHGPIPVGLTGSFTVLSPDEASKYFAYLRERVEREGQRVDPANVEQVLKKLDTMAEGTMKHRFGAIPRGMFRALQGMVRPDPRGSHKVMSDDHVVMPRSALN